MVQIRKSKPRSLKKLLQRVQPWWFFYEDEDSFSKIALVILSLLFFTTLAIYCLLQPT